MSRTKAPRPLTPEQKAKINAADYEVGHGKPPRTTRFQPGHSGNPSGRPKGKSMSVLLVELLDKPIEISSNGEAQQMSVREALVQIAGANSLKGSTRDREFLFRLLEKHLPSEFIETPPKRLNPDRAAILSRFKERNK